MQKAKIQLMTITILLVLGYGLAGCKKAAQQPKTFKKQAASQPAFRATSKLKVRNVVLFLGDSLTAGLRLAKKEAFPAKIGQVWKKLKMPWRSRNAGVSGDTAVGILNRLDWVISKDVHSVFLAVGANDGLRGKKIADIESDIEKIIKALQRKKVKIILAGIMLPPSQGIEYTKSFAQIYPRLAQKHGLKRMAFLLKDVAGKPNLNLADGVHPSGKGHQIIANNILSFFAKEGLFQAKKSQ